MTTLRIAFVLVLIFSFPQVAFSVVVVQDGKPVAVIVLPAEADENEQLAAEELRSHFRQISDADVAIVMSSTASDDQLPIFIGGAAEPSLDEALRKQGQDPAAFILKVTDDAIHLRGLSGEGALNAVYELLEQLGVRWFMPGELGTVIPRSRNIEIKNQTTIHAPAFGSRHLQAVSIDALSKDWYRRARLGGPMLPAAHGMPGIRGNRAKQLFEQKPEMFALKDGKRHHKQYCVTNADTIQTVADAILDDFRKNPESPWIGLGPHDGMGHCECSNCVALDGGDWDPFCNAVSKTDRYIWFFNELLGRIESEFPDKKLAFYAYSSYMRPPVKHKPDPRIVPALAPITLCRIHGVGNAVCPEQVYFRELMTSWCAASPQVYDRGYFFNLADPGFPFSKVHALREQIPLAKQLGLVGWRVETIPHWASMSPTIYVASRLMWNADADVDALLDDFYVRFFGPAAEPMGAYFTLMDAAMRDSDFHTGSSFDLPLIYDAQTMRRAKLQLDTAAQTAGDTVHGRRVALFTATFDYLHHFNQMLEQRTAHDHEAAYVSLQKIDALQEHLIDENELPMVSKSLAPAYLKRFFRQATEQAHQRTTGGNQFIVGLVDEWDFLLDPQGMGEDLGYTQADPVGGNWDRLKTSTTSWSSQGLRYYRGEAWYRQTIEIPAEFEGKRVFFWCGGVDEQAKVWVNGELIGISHASAFIPFELDATQAIKAGQPNSVAVRVSNRVLDELGTGGIMAPAFFYAPAKGDDAELDNTRKLAPRFPLY